MTIDLLDAVKGCTRTVNFQRHEACTTCGGSGAKPGTSPDRCDYCGGHGQVVQSQGFFRMQTTCPACHGEGTVMRDKCDECRGTTRTQESIALDVQVPRGVDSGMQLRLQGEGEAGLYGGPRGDLFVDIHIKEHPLFKRDGRDLICDFPVTYTQAALGADVEIPVLEGRHQQTFPPGTQPGDVIRIRGGGMPDLRSGRSGDLLVQIQVEVPTKLSEEHESLLRQLAELENANVSEHRTSFFEKLKEWFSPQDEGDE